MSQPAANSSPTAVSSLPTVTLNTTPGTTLLPGFTALPLPATPVLASSSEFVEYIVQEGDNLAQIAACIHHQHS